jgi:sirohydrochlorin cobaltochelatase
MAQTVILIGHGSLRSASGASMIRIAARLRDEGVAPVVEPAFLNFSRPTFAEAVARCRETGADTLLIQPYFLIEGAYVRHDLPRLVQETMRNFPDMDARIAPALGHHPALVDLARQRIYEAAPELKEQASDVRADWGLLLMAHGTPLSKANAPLYAILDELQAATDILRGSVAFLDCNAPDIPSGFQALAQAGARRILALPYFLHMGRHVRGDLPRLLAASVQDRPHIQLTQAQHLNYDLRLVRVIVDRLNEVRK